MIAAKPLTKKRSKFTAVVNPQRKRQAKPAARRKIRKNSGAKRRKNPVGPATVLLGYLNPEGKHVMKTKKKKTIRRRAKNPIVARAFTRKAKVNGRRPRRRNPLNMSIIGKPVELLKAGAIGAIAYFATRQVPQIVLKTRNTSWLGYLGNLLTALGCAGVAAKYFGPQAGQSAFVGGGMYLFGRVLNDQTPYGNALNLSGVGDPHAAGLRGLVPGFFSSPVITDRGGAAITAQFQPVIDAAVSAARAQNPAPAVAAGVSGGRFAARF
jgi:hypothetical protein